MRRLKLPGARSAFTLIEVVISASLMSMLLVAAYLCLRSGVSSQRLIESRGEAVQSARVAMAMMCADLRCACPLSKEIEFVGMDRMLGDVEADNLDFGTHHYSPQRPGEGDFCETSYFVNKDPESGKFSLWRRRDPTPDDEPLSGGSREEIARGVRGLRFEYYDGIIWYDEWGSPRSRGKKEKSELKEKSNVAGMPEAVRITLWIEPALPASRKKSGEDAESEPPLKFQTVVRINLAGVSFGSAISAPATDSQKPPQQSEGGTP